MSRQRKERWWDCFFEWWHGFRSDQGLTIDLHWRSKQAIRMGLEPSQDGSNERANLNNCFQFFLVKESNAIHMGGT